MTYLKKLITFNRYLLEMNPNICSEADSIPPTITEQRKLMRALMNVSYPITMSDEMQTIQDEILQEDLSKKNIVGLSDMKEFERGIYLYQGDITTLDVGAIVNAANDKMLGCFIPLHSCIDNAIHSAAGLQLRAECNSIMMENGYDAQTGQALITESYNLPCEKVIHTVGPVVTDRLSKRLRELLASCYTESIKLAVENNLKSIAFCCISTGVFGYPQKEAAMCAVETVRELKKQYNIDVIFNVFKDEDLKIYESLLK